MRNFIELRIWQKAFRIATNSFQITDSFPKQEKFGLAKELKFGDQELILLTLQLLTEEEKMLTTFKLSLKQQLNGPLLTPNSQHLFRKQQTYTRFL
jgi:23S rRNA-intervening sequence protein